MNTVSNEVSPERSRFEIIDDTQVLDRSTGLIWTRDNVPGDRMTQQAAEAACKELDLGSHMDWRLPTIRELLTLVDYERDDPAIDSEAFNCESSWYWTSTAAAPSPGDCAWVVYFGNGDAGWGYRGGGGFVRAVRAGQS